MPVEHLGVMTAERYYPAITDGRVRTLAQYAAAILGTVARRKGVRLPPLTEVSEAPSALAFVYRDQWMVGCPDCGRNFQLAWEREPLFMCAQCWNADAGGTWRRVEFPAEREVIEAVLSTRPRQYERNWLPDEQVDDLLSDVTRIRSVRRLNDRLRPRDRGGR